MLSSVNSGDDREYRSPISIPSALYFRQTDLDTLTHRIRRKSHSTGNHVSADFPMDTLREMKVIAGDGI